MPIDIAMVKELLDKLKDVNTTNISDGTIIELGFLSIAIAAGVAYVSIKKWKKDFNNRTSLHKGSNLIIKDTNPQKKAHK